MKTKSEGHPMLSSKKARYREAADELRSLAEQYVDEAKPHLESIVETGREYAESAKEFAGDKAAELAGAKKRKRSRRRKKLLTLLAFAALAAVAGFAAKRLTSDGEQWNNHTETPETDADQTTEQPDGPAGA
ncbi:MAG: hypothetical protein QM638_20545 [Nocardioides sp.]|uniref:hypothetical protein n=1 Tax=Nocardioides sp. TaxID=35761 RepID=UPI0039E69B80